MTTGRSRRFSWLVPLTALSLVLTGCQEETGSLAATPGADPETRSLPKESLEDVTMTVEECLVGSWKIDNDVFAANLNSMIDDPQMGDVSVELHGDRYLRFDGQGAYYTWSEDFTFSFPAMDGMTVEHVSNSVDTGFYDLDAVVDGISDLEDAAMLWIFDTMTVAEDEQFTLNGMPWESLPEADGIEVSFFGDDTAEVSMFGVWEGEIPDEVGREHIDGITPIRCSDDRLTIVYSEDDGVLLHRTDVTYE